MVELQPFIGTRYNPESIPDLSSAIAPPYDVISKEQQEAFYQRNPYNIIRLEYPIPNSNHDAYEVSALTLEDWKEKGVLKKDVLSFYLIRHSFNFIGKSYERLELLATVRIQPWSQGSVLPHEHTGESAKLDRLNMLRATNTNISPIMTLYDDKTNELSQILNRIVTRPPTVNEFTTQEMEQYTFWQITEPDEIEAIQNSVNGPLYIADGHHRYETSLNYKNEIGSTIDENAKTNYIMASITPIQDPGLISLPYHRMLENLSSDQVKRILRQIDVYFDSRTVSINNKSIEEISELIDKNIYQTPEPSIGFIDDDLNEILVLTVKDTEAAQGLFSSESEIWAQLSPCIFSDLLLKPALGMLQQEAEDKGYLTYTRDPLDAIHKLKSNKVDQVFILDGVPMARMTKIAQEGERLPHKSTYFHPKVATGFVLNTLDR
ncbi:MAG: DUF1015 family protein [Dehalococcoidia bacterium]